MTTITLSDRARARIGQLLKTSDTGGEQFGLRIAVEAYGWANRYRLSLTPQPHDGDVVVALGGIDAFVSGNAVALVDSVNIDYVETPATAGFTFDRPQLAIPPQASRGTIRSSDSETVATEDANGGGLLERVAAAIDEIRPYLQRDGGDVTLVTVAGEVAWVRLEAACAGCSTAHVTVASVIEQRVVAAVPEITRIAVVP